MRDFCAGKLRVVFEVKRDLPQTYSISAPLTCVVKSFVCAVASTDTGWLLLLWRRSSGGDERQLLTLRAAPRVVLRRGQHQRSFPLSPSRLPSFLAHEYGLKFWAEFEKWPLRKTPLRAINERKANAKRGRCDFELRTEDGPRVTQLHVTPGRASLLRKRDTLRITLHGRIYFVMYHQVIN